MLLEEAHGQEDDVVEIDGVAGFQLLLVSWIDPGDQLLDSVAEMGLEIDRQDKPVFQRGDFPVNRLCGDLFAISADFTHGLADQAELV